MLVNDIKFKDLETKGFIVIPKFLSENLISNLIDQHKTIHESQNKNYNVGIFSINLDLRKVVSDVLDLVRFDTNIQVDLIPESGVYFDNSKINFNWHQDHETYFKWQDCYNSLNFWIPVIKPIHDKSGISMIPFDKLTSCFPNLIKNDFIGQGAKRIWPGKNKTLVVDDERGKTYEIPIVLDAIMYTPDLMPGDLVIMRGDVIHRTQDCDTARLGISIHCENGNNWITREKFESGSEHKREMIKKNFAGFKRIIEAFKLDDKIQVKEVFN